MAQKSLTGNRAILKFAGTAVGFISNVSFQDQQNLQELDGLGDAEVQEFVTGKITHVISGDKLVVNQDTLQKLGFMPKSEDWFTAPEFTVEVIDQKAGATIENYTGCKFDSVSRKYAKHTIISEDFTIKARHRQAQ